MKKYLADFLSIFIVNAFAFADSDPVYITPPRMEKSQKVQEDAGHRTEAYERAGREVGRLGGIAVAAAGGGDVGGAIGEHMGDLQHKQDIKNLEKEFTMPPSNRNGGPVIYY